VVEIKEVNWKEKEFGGKVFDKFDVDGDGFVNLFEVRGMVDSGLRAVGVKWDVSDDDVVNLMVGEEMGDDGQVGRDWFVNLMVKAFKKVGVKFK
jgi:Ca2+-binding EF-hand superfamily protein